MLRLLRFRRVVDTICRACEELLFVLPQLTITGNRMRLIRDGIRYVWIWVNLV